MTAYNVLEEAVLLCGQSTPDEQLKSAGVHLINTILNDLNCANVKSLSSDIDCSRSGFKTTLVTGVAMLISTLQGDDYSLSCLNEVYNSQRKQLLSHIATVKNTIYRGGTV